MKIKSFLYQFIIIQCWFCTMSINYLFSGRIYEKFEKILLSKNVFNKNNEHMNIFLQNRLNDIPNE